MSQIIKNADRDTPLCVDLDGTLLNTDTLVESAVLLAKSNPLYIFAMIFWLFSGKANLKNQISARTKLDVTSLPYNRSLLDWLHVQREAGRNIVLVTAANHRIADAIGAHLQIFSKILASSSEHNLSAATKRDELDKNFGKGGYDYAGNSNDDLQVWEHCRKAVLVNVSASLAQRAAARCDIEARFPSAHNPIRELFRAMRPHQWSKNLLVFVSLFTAHKYTDVPLLILTTISFFSFCLCSSAVYLINDLLDLESDRKHSEKHKRPFASGGAPVTLGLLVVPVLLAVSFALACIAGKQFLNVLAIYFGLTLVYSFYLKRLVLLDVLVLAILYTLRIIAGAAAASVVASFWLVAFSMFIFTSLAMAKRYAELKALEQHSTSWASGRGYHVSDLNIVAQLGCAAGFISTLVFALYINSPDKMALYKNQQILWLLFPLLMYWIARIWLIASRGQLHQDPVVFATRDRVSYVVFGLSLLMIMAAR